MQTISAYLLESSLLDAQQLSARFDSVVNALSGWLEKKGANEPGAPAGDFQSLTKDGRGSFVRVKHAVSLGRLESVRLEEFTRAGHIFTTQVTATASQNRLRIHCTLNVANAAAVVAPLSVDPRCPSILRALFSDANDWQLNGWPIAAGSPTSQNGKAGGITVAVQIRDIARTLPLVVVSEIEGEQLWPDLAKELAFDLAGLAQVVTIDDDATWSLSDQVGKFHSCYRGAVRLYWPPSKRADESIHFRSTVWTASELVSNDQDGKGLTRLRAALRKTLMSTAALSIPSPAAARDIEAEVARERIAGLESRSAPDSEELAIARLYLSENELLKRRVELLEAELANAAARAEAATHSLSQLKATGSDDGPTGQSQADSAEPIAGDTKFYKKTHSKSAYDVLWKSRAAATQLGRTHHPPIKQGRASSASREGATGKVCCTAALAQVVECGKSAGSCGSLWGVVRRSSRRGKVPITAYEISQVHSLDESKK